MFVPVNIQGARVDYEPLEQLALEVRDMKTPLTAIGMRLREGVARMFETEGASGDRPWAQLKDGYRRWKEARGPGLPILVGLEAIGEKGTRANPITGKQYKPSGKMRLELIAPRSVTVSPTRMLYAPASDIAGFHQTGTKHMPARPPVTITLRELAEWDRIFGTWLEGLLERVHA